jgi:peptide/nickel transport system substrate-binding protein
MLIHRRNMMKVMGVSALALSAPWSADAQDNTPRRGGTLTVGLVQDNTKTLDPRFSIQLDERQVLFLLYDALLALDNDFSLKPDLAKSWQVENDGKRYVFTLQEGVKFQDGTPFDAAVAKWNIEQRLDENVKAPLRAQLRPVIASIDVVSANVLAINLNYPYPALLADLADRAGMMISPAASQKFGADYGRNPVGTGAFGLKQWTQGTSITLARNPDYWRKGEPYLDGVVFRTVPTAILGLQRIAIGEVDMMANIGPAEAKQIDQRTTVALKIPIGRWYAMQWQVDKPPFNNAKLRMAIAHAIDRDAMNKILFDGQGTIAEGLTPQGLWFTPPAKPTFHYSPEKARALLKESGWNMDEPITLWAPSEATYSKMSQLVAEQVQAIGLKVTLAPVAQSEYYARVVQRVVNFAPTSWGQRADPDGLYNYLLYSKGAANTTGYNNPEVDRLLEKGRSITNREERVKIYSQVQDLFMQDLPYICLLFGADYVAVSTKLRNWAPSPDTFPRLRATWKTA